MDCSSSLEHLLRDDINKTMKIITWLFSSWVTTRTGFHWWLPISRKYQNNPLLQRVNYDDPALLVLMVLLSMIFDHFMTKLFNVEHSIIIVRNFFEMSSSINVFKRLFHFSVNWDFLFVGEQPCTSMHEIFWVHKPSQDYQLALPIFHNWFEAFEKKCHYYL